jgi:hypothetical protein
MPLRSLHLLADPAVEVRAAESEESGERLPLAQPSTLMNRSAMSSDMKSSSAERSRV